MDAGKIAISPMDIRTLVMVLFGVVAVETALRTVAWHEAVCPLLFLGLLRLIQAGLIVGVVLVEKKGVSAVGLSAGTAFSGFQRGLFWTLCWGGIAFLLWVSFLAMGINPLPFIKTPLPVKTGDVMLFFLVGGLIAPVAEELFFRGVVYGFLRRWGIVTAVALSSLAFVLIHMAFSGICFTHFVGAIVFALAYEVERNLMVPITLHAIGNLTLFAISLV